MSINFGVAFWVNFLRRHALSSQVSKIDRQTGREEETTGLGFEAQVRFGYIEPVGCRPNALYASA